MKLVLHATLCGVGVSVPVVLLHADPFLIPINVLVIVAACLTYERYVER